MLNSLLGPEVMDAKASTARRTPDSSSRHFATSARGRKAGIEERAHDCLAFLFCQAGGHHRMFDRLHDGVDESAPAQTWACQRTDACKRRTSLSCHLQSPEIMTPRDFRASMTSTRSKVTQSPRWSHMVMSPGLSATAQCLQDPFFHSKSTRCQWLLEGARAPPSAKAAFPVVEGLLHVWNQIPACVIVAGLGAHQVRVVDEGVTDKGDDGT